MNALPFPDGAFAAAAVKIDATYHTAHESHSMMEPHASIAAWDGESWRSLGGGMNNVVRALAVFPATNELIAAGVMLDGGGLKDSSKGARVSFDGPEPMVIDGPHREDDAAPAHVGYWH